VGTDRAPATDGVELDPGSYVLRVEVLDEAGAVVGKQKVPFRLLYASLSQRVFGFGRLMIGVLGLVVLPC
jgi:hypothetical protein